MSTSTRTSKFWLGLGLATGLAASSALGATAEMKFNKKPTTTVSKGDGGEGEGAVAKAAGDDTALLTQIAVIEAHTTLGVELSGRGDSEGAKAQMLKARELYRGLKSLLKAAKRPGFAKELDALDKAIQSSGPGELVTILTDKLNEKIARARPKKLEAPFAAKAMVNLLRLASDEYSDGVKDGKIVELKKYQDAWGFTKAAAHLLAVLPQSERDEHAKDIAELERELSALDTMWPDILGKTVPTRQPKELAAAAARIELIALSIK